MLLLILAIACVTCVMGLSLQDHQTDAQWKQHGGRVIGLLHGHHNGSLKRPIETSSQEDGPNESGEKMGVKPRSRRDDEAPAYNWTGLVNYHNTLRRQEGAANMDLMVCMKRPYL